MRNKCLPTFHNSVFPFHCSDPLLPRYILFNQYQWFLIMPKFELSGLNLYIKNDVEIVAFMQTKRKTTPLSLSHIYRVLFLAWIIRVFGSIIQFILYWLYFSSAKYTQCHKNITKFSLPCKVSVIWFVGFFRLFFCYALIPTRTFVI